MEVIRELLLDPDLLVKKLEQTDDNKMTYSGSTSRGFFSKWRYSGSADDGDAFILLLCQGLRLHKENLLCAEEENVEKSTMALLTEVFGTAEFSDLKIKEIKEQNLFQTIGECLVDDNYDEKVRQNETRSMKHAEGIDIECKTGEHLYFGKTALFYFLVSKGYVEKCRFPVYKDFKEILFADGYRESVRKRPGIFICYEKMGQMLCQLLFGLTEELLEAANEKIITIRLLPQNVMEISCEGYSGRDNPGYPFIEGGNLFAERVDYHLAVAGALGEFFEYQDETQWVRTEKGILTVTDDKNVATKGTKIVWKADRSIFKEPEWDYYIIMNRMMELAALNPYVIYLSDGNNQNKIHIPSGLASFFERDCSLFVRDSPLLINFAGDRFYGTVAVVFSPFSDLRKSYINNHISQDGGTHEEGVLLGAKKALKSILECYDNSLTPGDLIKCLNFVIHLHIEKPRWVGSTTRRLKNFEVKPVIQKQVEKQLYLFLKQDISPLKSIYYHLF